MFAYLKRTQFTVRHSRLLMIQASFQEFYKFRGFCFPFNRFLTRYLPPRKVKTTKVHQHFTKMCTFLSFQFYHLQDKDIVTL